MAAAKYPERWFGAGEVGDDELTEEASVKVSLEACEEALERVETLWSESSAEWADASDGTFWRGTISGALYESMLVVETRATGAEILARSIWRLAFLTVRLSGGDDGEVLGASGRFMRLVKPRASDMLTI